MVNLIKPILLVLMLILVGCFYRPKAVFDCTHVSAGPSPTYTQERVGNVVASRVILNYQESDLLDNLSPDCHDVYPDGGLLRPTDPQDACWRSTISFTPPTNASGFLRHIVHGAGGGVQPPLWIPDLGVQVHYIQYPEYLQVNPVGRTGPGGAAVAISEEIARQALSRFYDYHMSDDHIIRRRIYFYHVVPE